MKLTVQTFLTLDGVMQAPGGPEEDPSDAFTHGGWQAPFPDPAVGEFVTELNGHASAFLFGRRTFDIFRGYWPDQTDAANPIATAINSLPKYVVSNSLSEADATWRREHPDTARLVTGDVVAAVQALKDEPGDELQIWGSGGLIQTLLRHELVDRFRLMTFPLVLGLRSSLVQRGNPPDDDAPRRPHRDRSRHRHRHLRTSRSGPPRPDVTGWGWPRWAVTPRLAITVAMTSTSPARWMPRRADGRRSVHRRWRYSVLARLPAALALTLGGVSRDLAAVLRRLMSEDVGERQGENSTASTKRTDAMINGAHVMLYSRDADADRAFLRDMLGFAGVDAGDGWLILRLPPAEIGVHPTDGESTHEMYLMCDDLVGTLDELAAKGVKTSGVPADRGWGLVASITLPSGAELPLYEPRHPVAHERSP